MKNGINQPVHASRYQSGVVTTFTGVMMLVLLGLMMFFAMRVNVFEQRVSSNEMRQKLAFHAAESGLQHAKEYFRANTFLVASSRAEVLGDGTPGWLSDGNERWQPCRDANLQTDSGSHPCFAEPDAERREDLFYWSADNSLQVPVDTAGLLPGTTEVVEVQALLCAMLIDEEAETVQDCSTDTDLVDGSRYMVTLLSRARSDCRSDTECSAEAMITEKVSNFGGAAGGRAPAVPLTTKNMFPPSGAAEIVANPNGGGVGVPISVWMNRNAQCTPDGSAIDPSQGSWATCEAHEWYELEGLPEDAQCPGSCSCAVQESLSYTHGTEDILGIDLVQDENFPCDLFQFYFGTPSSNYEIIKSFSTVLADCDSLGPGSSGVYWISGTDCNIQANVSIGSPYAPVLLVSAAGVTSMQGGATVFGVLYVADVENQNAYFESRGNNIVYGQVILDAEFGSYNGTFQVVYNENLITRIAGSGDLGNMPGTWADFHTSWQ
ncbi:MAG: hypothetical protein GWP58_09685 [Gammaproteobacteria bacterium]|nr:hypothetical protein [Gammaproteobacteria bacterium]